MPRNAAAATIRPKGSEETVFDDDTEDCYYNDDRPTLDPVERPTHTRCERPMRTTTAQRMGPSREKSR